MKDRCSFCDNIKPPHKLKAIELDTCERINEIFHINLNEFDDISQLKLCGKCIGDLSISCKFAKCVERAKERLNNSRANNVMIKVEVEVKQEPSVEFALGDFPFFSPFDNASDSDEESVKKENDIPAVAAKKKNTRTTKKAKVEKEKPVKKYRKLLPHERKINRGIRRAKEAIKISTKDLYKNELANNFTDEPECLQILAEDKLPGGRVSERITQLFEPNSWPTYSWPCEHCPDTPTFTNVMQLNEHLHRAHKLKYKRRCHECQKTTHHFAACINHIIEHHTTQNKFCCILCPRPQLRWSLRDLYHHYESEHREPKIFFCIYCGLHFIGGAKLKEHLINKHKRPPDEEGKLECDICGFTTFLRPKMKSHMIKHASSETFMCDQCTTTFATSSYLSTHIKQVHSRIEINCTKCDKLFRSERRLRVHDRSVHQNNKQYLCHICDKAFHAQYRLNSHIKIHTDAAEEKHQCPHCERRFKYKPGMIYHIRAAHTGETPYYCPIDGCHDRFYDYSNARKHISGAHNSQLKPMKD